MTQTTTTLQQIDDVIAELKTMAPQTEVPFLRSLGKCTILICSGPKRETICTNPGDFEASTEGANAQ